MSVPKFVQIATGICGNHEDLDHVLYGLDEEGRVWYQAEKRINGETYRYWRRDSEMLSADLPKPREVKT